MELKELLDLHEKLEVRVNAYWTYWSVAIFAMLGWVFSGKGDLTYGQALGVAVGAAAFFCANLGMLYPATQRVEGVLDEIRLKAAQSPPLSSKLAAAYAAGGPRWRRQATVVLHLLIDVVVIGIVLFRPLQLSP